MFSVHNPGKMFSEHVLGTRAFILRALWNVLGTHSFKVENGTHLGLRSMTYCVYTVQRVRSFWCALSVLIAVCVLSPAYLEHCSRYTSVHTCFGSVLRGRYVPRTWFDHVPAGTVLAGTILFRTRSDYKKWCVPRTCSENMFPLELYREQVWTPGTWCLIIQHVSKTFRFKANSLWTGVMEEVCPWPMSHAGGNEKIAITKHPDIWGIRCKKVLTHKSVILRYSHSKVCINVQVNYRNKRSGAIWPSY